MAPAQNAAAAELSLSGAVLLPEPGDGTAIGLLEIRNDTPETEKLVSVRSDTVPARLMHNVEVGEQMRMIPVDRLAIPRGKTLMFSPEALHLRFDLPESGLAPGASIAVTLVFEPAGTRDVVFVMQPAAGAALTGE